MATRTDVSKKDFTVSCPILLAPCLCARDGWFHAQPTLSAAPLHEEPRCPVSCTLTHCRALGAKRYGRRTTPIPVALQAPVAVAREPAWAEPDGRPGRCLAWYS